LIKETAHKNGTTLRQEAVGGGTITFADFDAIHRAAGEDDRAGVMWRQEWIVGLAPAA
jgi:hypothetical protein